MAVAGLGNLFGGFLHLPHLLLLLLTVCLTVPQSVVGGDLRCSKMCHDVLHRRRSVNLAATRSVGRRDGRRAGLPAFAARAHKGKLVAENRQARRNYEILEELEAGISLVGTEVKACRQGKLQLQDGFAQIKDGECWLKNVHIGPHSGSGVYFQHEAKRDRRLLIHKRQILKYDQAAKMKGLTIVPLTAYFNDANILKLTIGLARGKNVRDKREDIKARDMKREIQRALKTF